MIHLSFISVKTVTFHNQPKILKRLFDSGFRKELPADCLVKTGKYGIISIIFKCYYENSSLKVDLEFPKMN